MFVYILHFDDPLSHAQHYVGCTNAVQARLATHANGQGAKLTSVLADQGRSWRLGGLMQTTTVNGRKVERELKDQHNAARYCQICNDHPPKFPKAKRYPIESLPFPTDSEGLKKDGETKEPFAVIEAKQDDLAWIISKMSTEKAELGFIPQAGVSRAITHGKVLVTKAANEITGYLIFTNMHSYQNTKLQQLYVADEWRMKEHGRSMIAAVSARYPNSTVNAKVREDLPANFFWETIGFDKLRTITHPTSKNKLNYYHKPALLTKLQTAATPQPKETEECT